MAIKTMTPEQRAELQAEIDAADAAGMELGHYRVKQRLAAKGLEWTRENYIEHVWRGELPIDPTSGQAYVPEDELPEEFQA